MTDNRETLNSIFKEIYSQHLTNLIPHGVTLFKKKEPIYTEAQMKRLKKTKLGEIVDIDYIENVKS